MRQYGFGALLLAAYAAEAACSTVTKTVALVDCKDPGKLFQTMQKKLSAGSAVYLPGTSEFISATTRWSDLDTPTVDVVVVPGSEADVAQIVAKAHTCSLPILAFNGVHGSITTLGNMKGGVAISLSNLSSVTVSEDGTTAVIGGGTMAKTVIDDLWAAGKQTVTGTCECVSYFGPALGGGHGWLQGHHGLVSDQFLSLNVVFADGTQQTIDSSSDLWWGMRGAGQNFGIVTSATVKVYDIQYRDWAIETMIFDGSKVEEVYQAANDLLPNIPPTLINWSYWLNIPDVDPENPIILFYMIQEGVTAVDSTYTSPFHAIGPISVEPQSGSYQDLAGWTETALDSAPCQKNGLANPRFPIYVEQYNVAAQKQAYDTFAANVGGGNSPFNASIFMFEAYPQQGVKAFADNATAFAFRVDNVLAAPLITYLSTGEEIDDQARTLGDELRNIIYEGTARDELHTYVNYANGDEQPENWFGYDAWRWDRLRDLKSKYDPNSSFSFYAPIA